jgi:hypothetical protein
MILATSKKRLQDFIDRSDRVETLSYLENQENITGFEIIQTDEGPQVEFYQPDDEKRDALLFNLRLFVQDKDDYSIRRLCELYDDPDVSDLWKDEHRAIRSELNVKLDRVAAEGDRGRITHRDVFYMFLYGCLGHSDEDDRYYQLYREWITDENVYKILHNTLHIVLVWILAAVMNISRASKEELARLDNASSR